MVFFTVLWSVYSISVLPCMYPLRHHLLLLVSHIFSLFQPLRWFLHCRLPPWPEGSSHQAQQGQEDAHSVSFPLRYSKLIASQGREEGKNAESDVSFHVGGGASEDNPDSAHFTLATFSTNQTLRCHILPWFWLCFRAALFKITLLSFSVLQLFSSLTPLG